MVLKPLRKKGLMECLRTGTGDGDSSEVTGNGLVVEQSTRHRRNSVIGPCGVNSSNVTCPRGRRWVTAFADGSLFGSHARGVELVVFRSHTKESADTRRNERGANARDEKK